MKWLFLIYLFICFKSVAQKNTLLYFNKDTIKQNLYALAHDSMQGRRTPSIGLEKSAQLIKRWFENAGLKPLDFAPNYEDTFFVKVKTDFLLAKNIIGCIKGTDKNKIIIISAHYDHIGTTADVTPFEHRDKNPRDPIFNGANDDASGVVAMVEIAKYYNSLDSIKPTILFVAFAGEELGLLGSNYFSLFCNDVNIEAVVNLEMLGRSLYTNTVFVINEIGGKKVAKNLNNNLAKALGIKKVNFFCHDLFPEQNTAGRNDAASFTKISRNAFCLIATNDKDPYYHTSKDEANTIDYKFLKLAIHNIALACEAFLY